MEYPLQVELDISQDDFIMVEILEQELESRLARKSYLRTFVLESVICALISIMIVFMKNIIAFEAVYFVLFFWMLFLAIFLLNYFSGYKKEFSYAVNHILTQKDSHTFFTPEKGMAFFYEDRAEYLTDEQRRFFSYDKIQNIKITDHLFIFVMKRCKEKSMRGFAYMVIPKRNLSESQEIFLNEICDGIVKKYNLKEWIKSEIFG